MTPLSKGAGRIYAILARKAPFAVVFRRGPSKQVLTVRTLRGKRCANGCDGKVQNPRRCWRAKRFHGEEAAARNALEVVL